MYHRFIPDKQNYIRARRFFVGEPILTSINQLGDDTHPSRQPYVEHLYRNGTVDTSKNIIDAIS
jgi:1,2-dihydroxy-3-keto-5-methylthiopentene dioxygenase